MGLIRPSIKPDDIQKLSEIERLLVRAQLPKSKGAGILQVAGIIVVAIGVLTILANPLSLIVSASGAIGGGLIWAAGLVSQMAFDIRTLKLREADRLETALLASEANA